MPDWIPIFTTGVHHGEAFTDNDINQIVLNFKDYTKEVPLVIGHEGKEFQDALKKQTGIPKFGVVKALKAKAGMLFAKLDGVHATVKEWIDNNFFTDRSVELGEGQNGLFLFRLGLLGASPPEVPGLPPLLTEHMADSPQALKTIMQKNKDAKPMPVKPPAPMQEDPTGEEIAPSIEERVASMEAQITQIMEILQKQEAPAEGTPVAPAAIQDVETHVEATELKALRAELKANQDRIGKMEADRLTEKTAALNAENIKLVDEMCVKGQLSPTMRQDALDTLNKSSNGTRASVIKMFAAMPENELFQEMAASGGEVDTPDEKIRREVEADFENVEYRKYTTLTKDQVLKARLTKRL